MSAQDPLRLLAAAAVQTAGDLTDTGFAAVAADGPDLHARRGRHCFVMSNRAVPGQPGGREQVLNQFAGLIVRSLLDAPGGPCHLAGEGEVSGGPKASPSASTPRVIMVMDAPNEPNLPMEESV